jgi:hypothetical protein
VKTPPAASIRLGASVVYRVVVLVCTILLIAAYVLATRTLGLFSLQNTAMCGLGALAIAAGVWDAWRPRTGALHYAAGQWVLAQEGVESQGTLVVVVDLSSYILARFIPVDHVLDATPQHPPTQWLHLESRHGQDWLALRRALFAPPTDAPEPKPV